MTEPQLPKGNILLVAIDQETVSTLTDLLVARGFRVHALTTGDRALKEAREISPDLILLDSNLAGMDTQELCQRLRATGIAPASPILVLSDASEPETVSELVAAGATDVLVRAFGEHLLLSRLETALELAVLRRELARRDDLLERETATRMQVEESVRFAELSGRELVENLSEVIYTAAPDGVLTYISPAIERLLGYKPEALIGWHFSDIVHPDMHAMLAECMQRVLAGHREASEYRLVTKTGDTRWVHTSSQPAYDEEQGLGLQGVLTDITERKRAEEQIRHHNEFLTTVLESLTHPFYVLNVRDYTIEMANSAARFESLTGDSTCYALTHRRDAPCSSAEHPCPIDELKRTGKPVTVEHVHYDSRDRERFVEVNSYPLFDRQGNLVRAIEYTLDITERKRAEQALRDASEEAEQARQAEQVRRRESDQRRRVAESLAGVMAALNSDEPLDRVLDHIAGQARDLLDNEAVTIFSLDPSSGVPLPQAAQGPARADLQTIDQACSLQIIGQALASRQPLVIGDLETVSPASARPFPAPFRALLAVPVIVKDQVYGGMVMCGAEPRGFSGEEVELASVFANQVALAVESAQLRSQHEQAAAAAERNRLARDLHDSVTQALFSASLVAEILPQVWERNADLGREGLQELGVLTRGALAEMRTMLLELRPTALIETRLDELVWQLTEAMTGRAGLLVTYDIEPSPSLPPEVHVTFYRVAQEALNNVLKHAEARQVTVGLAAVPPADTQSASEWRGQLELAISDDGQGFDSGDAEPDRLGLGIMRERAETIGAALEIVGSPGRGTRITLTWPRAEIAMGA